jgi:AraC family transcriptional activator of tynA and feaB
MQIVEARSADEWEHVTSDAFVPLTCVALEPDFHGRIEFERFDEQLLVSHVTTDGLAVDRTARQAAHANSDDIHLTFQLGAPGIVRQDGHEARVRAGSVTTYATDRAYQLDYSAPGQRQVLVQVSKRALGIPVDLVEASCARLLVTATDAAEVLFATITEARGLAGPDVGETVRDLAGTMIRSSVTGARVLPATRGGMLATVRSYMRGNLHDAELDVAHIADAHHISRRFLYELFEPFDETPGEHLRRLRLSRAAALLADPRAGTVLEVAARCGFADATTFTRAFHREFGMLPREYRAPQS